MNNPLWKKSLTLGVKRRWWEGVKMGFGAVGVAWTLAEVLTKAIKPLDAYVDTHGIDFLCFIVALFVLVFIGYVAEPITVTFKVPTTHTKITLKYGDLFTEEANLLIGVNEFFDGELGQPVSPNSLHGQLIVRNYQSNAAAFRAAVDPALTATGVAPAQTTRQVQPSDAFPIGTTVRVPNGTHDAFLVAIAKTDLVNFKANSDPAMLWNALQGGFRAVHAFGGGCPLAMPLFGNGQSGINLPPQHLLRLLTLALVDFGRNSSTQLPKRVTVVLHDGCFEELDIREIARDWKKDV